jgi:16S rRNA (guanine1516-N2)-methyltransferase
VIHIAVFPTHPDLYSKAISLSKQLGIACIFEISDTYDYLLLLTPDYLGLQKTGAPSKPLFIDFLSGTMRYRRQNASLRKEMLLRALGLKNKSPKKIVDATAGLARDSFILASLGFEVTLLERSPLIFALIEDAIHRALSQSDVAPIVKRLHLIQTDAINWLQNNASPDIIYLDPMFPERKKTALSKLDMRIFHDIVGEDTDAAPLLKIALTCASERVVVKRPRLAPPLANLLPTFSMEGKSNRFDIYLIKGSHGNNSSTA